MTEYALRTFAETWVEKVLKQLLRLEQYYETDDVILALAGGKVENELKFNVDDLLDDLLRQDVVLKVNVGIEATNPMSKINNLMTALAGLGSIPGFMEQINLPEVAKEVFGQLGFKDGDRFISFDEDPRIQEMAGQLQELQGALESEQLKLQNRVQIEQLKQQGNLQAANIKSATDLRVAQMKAQIEYIDLKLKEEDVETRRSELILQREALLNQIAEQEIARQAEMVGDNKVGIMSRDDYASIPYAVG